MNEKVIYNPKEYGIENNENGKNCNISLISSGYPDDLNIKNTIEVENLVEDEDFVDIDGQATVISSIICGNNKKISGIAKNTNMYYIKIIDKEGNSTIESISTAILWSIIKNVDIIVLPILLYKDYNKIKNAISKAKAKNIPILVSKQKNNGILEHYDGTISCSLNRYLKKDYIFNKNSIEIRPPKTNLAYFDKDNIVKPRNEIMAISLATGILSNKISELKGDYNIKKLYNYI